MKETEGKKIFEDLSNRIENIQEKVEIKSVNNRYCDISVKLPRSISYLEEKVKKEITNKVSRGKIDVFISFYNNSTKGKSIKFNRELAGIYINELRELAKENGINLILFPFVLLL